MAPYGSLLCCQLCSCPCSKPEYSHLWPGLTSGLFPSCFPTKTLYEFLFSSMHTTCPTHLILLDVIPRTLFGVGYKSRCPRYVTFSSLLLPRPSQAHISSSAPRSQTPSGYIAQLVPYSPLAHSTSNFSERSAIRSLSSTYFNFKVLFLTNQCHIP